MELSIPGNSENKMIMYMFTNHLLSASYNLDRIYILTQNTVVNKYFKLKDQTHVNFLIINYNIIILYRN